ncbi:tail fiber domain-containing protein [Candidatus Bathyarchaeota archaeon]|nr:tail fiber domain-containing protein [Candidatus Bathyarchaeota archaeon]
MTDFTDVGISHELKLQSTNIPTLSDADIIKKIWWFEDGMWNPEGLDPDPDGVYEMFRAGTDQDPGVSVKLFEIISSTYGMPLLATDEGLVVQKDISAGGFLGSNQGELWLGSGRNDQVDVPKIVLGNSSVSRLQGGGPLDVPEIPSDDEFPAGENGQLFIYTPTSSLYKHNGSTWVYLGPTSNYAGYFDTLYIRKANAQDPAHLDIGDINIHGHLGVGDTVTSDLNPNPDLDLGNYNNPWASVVTSSLWVKSPNTQFGVTAGDEWNGSGYDAYLHPQNPANGGLGLGTANYPFKWVDATTVFTNGINILSGDTLTVNGNLAIVNNSVSPEIKISSTKSVKLTLEADTDNATETDQPLLFFSQDSGIVTASAGFLNGENAFSIMQHYADSLKLGTNNAVRATITSAGQLQLAVSGSSGGLKIGDDVNLYRSEQDVLKTDDSFVCNNIAGNGAIFNSVKGTYSGAAVKAGDYITLSWDATYSKITAHGRHLQLNTDVGKNVIVYRDLSVGGKIYINSDPNILTSDDDMLFYKASGAGSYWFRRGTPGSYLDLLRLDNSGTAYFAGDVYVGGRRLYNDSGYLRCNSHVICDAALFVGTWANTTYAGPLYRNSSGQIGYNMSTLRHKKNVENVEDASWIYDLRVVEFDWTDEKRQSEEGRQFGLIAEEVNEICPKLVWKDKDGLPEGVHYEWLGIPLLVEIKKLRQRVETLENQLKQNPTAA